MDEEKIPPQRFEVVRACLDTHQERVEAGDVDARGVIAGLERLHERRPRAGERVEHASPRRDVALEHRLDELGNELAEIRMQAMDVPGALALGEFSLRPREREIELAVDRLLGRGHDRLVLCPRLVS